ncbi:MAG: hypothetical protein HQK78_17430 [Desulfobacterales bacterium]|nr:hypothetical protein [Desulfobacterales bacterium]
MKMDNLTNNGKEGFPDEETLELREEDLLKGKPNRFAKHIFRLDNDVSFFFKTPQAVNKALRLVIQLSQMVPHK